MPTATRTTSSSARRYSLSHARCTTLRPRASHASTPAAYHAQSQPRDSAKPSKHRWRKAEEMSPLQAQSGNKCEPPSTNRGWRPLGRKSVATRTGSRRTGRKWSQNNPCQATRDALRAARSKCQESARRCANDYWLKLSERIQADADYGNTGGMYAGIKQATGPITTKSVPLKTKSGENITDKKKQMERWVEHYFELYSTENVVADAVLDAICQLPVMQELDEKPTEEELRKAIDCLSTGKAPGEDGIPGEVIKAGKEELIEDLHELLCLCWKEGSVPQDIRDAKIATLYKNKGDRSDCNSYRGISLLSIVGKVFARVILARLKVLAARVYPESQCGFRAGRSTIDMIFSVRQLQEKCQEQNEPLFLAFIDLTKAFDLVSRSGLFQLLKKIGCPPKLHSIIQSFHTDMRSTVSYNGARSEPFPISSGV